MPRSWSISDLESVLSSTERGRETIDICKDANCNIEIHKPQNDPNVVGAAGYYDNESSTIVINRNQSLPEAVNTLAHEAEHLRQHKEGRSPDVNGDKEKYINDVMKCEASAETNANRIAYDLYKSQNYSAPLEAQMSPDNAFSAQASEYVRCREAGLSHDESARLSEPLVDQNPDVKQFYNEKAASDWEKNNPNARQIPEANKWATDQMAGFEELRTVQSALDGKTMTQGAGGATPSATNIPTAPMTAGDKWAQEQMADFEDLKTYQPTQDPNAQTHGRSR